MRELKWYPILFSVVYTENGVYTKINGKMELFIITKDLDTQCCVRNHYVFLKTMLSLQDFKGL